MFKLLNNYHFKPQHILYAHSMSAIPQMVSEGYGISFFPANMMSDTMATCASFSFTPACIFQYIAAYRKSRILNDYDELLARLCIQHCSQFHDFF